MHSALQSAIDTPFREPIPAIPQLLFARFKARKKKRKIVKNAHYRFFGT